MNEKVQRMLLNTSSYVKHSWAFLPSLYFHSKFSSIIVLFKYRWSTSRFTVVSIQNTIYSYIIIY